MNQFGIFYSVGRFEYWFFVWKVKPKSIKSESAFSTVQVLLKFLEELVRIKSMQVGLFRFLKQVF